MRSAYPILFLCALACATGPSAARLSTTGTAPLPTAGLATNTTEVATRGTILTGDFRTDYYSGETLYDVLRRRLPLYLRTRPNPSTLLTPRNDEISVFINGSFSGSLDVLQLIPAHEVFSVDRIGSTEAAIKLGPKHANGALMITLVRRD